MLRGEAPAGGKKKKAWKLTKEIDMSGEKRLENYLAKGKVKIEGYFERLYHYKEKKNMMEGRNSKVAFSREKFLKTRGTGVQTHLRTELQSKTKEMHGAHGVHTGEFSDG